MSPATVHEGMKVFAGDQEIGKVTTVSDESFEVTRGLVNRHVYVIPKKYIEEAGEDVVDLNIGTEQVDALESTGQTEPAELPEEFKKIEGFEESPASQMDDPDVFLRR